MQEEVDQKTIALAVKTGKLTAQVLQAAIRKYLAARQKGTGKAHHGQQSLRQLKKDGSALSNIEITDANIGLFKPCAKKYDIDFTLRKDRTIKIEEMRLQETEVVDVQWVSSDKLFEMFRLKQLHPLITYVDQLIG